MSNKTQLQTNNTNLDALITRVNAAKDTAASLPEAGGGGGANIETCTVKIEFSSGIYFYSYGAQTYENGVISTHLKYGSGAYSSSPIIINNVIVGGIIIIETTNTVGAYHVTTTNAQVIASAGYTIYAISNIANDIATINIISQDAAGGGN